MKKTSLKAQIMNLVNMKNVDSYVVGDGTYGRYEEATYQLNSVARLNRWLGTTWDGTKEVPLDVLELTVRIFGYDCGKSFKIKSRDYDGIIDEIGKDIEETYTEAAQTIAKELKNGYRR